MPATPTSRLLYVIVAAIALCSGCDNSFSPKAEFTPKLAVFAVLDPSLQSQVVRIEHSYDAEIGGVIVPLSYEEIASAQVTLLGPRGTITLHDTLIALAGGGTRHVWTAPGISPTVDQHFTLSVSVPGYPKVSSETTVPSRCYVTADYVTSDSGVASVRVHAGVDAYDTPPTGWYYRMNVVMQKGSGAEQREMRREVPTVLASATMPAVYTSPSRFPSVVFTKKAIQHVHDELMAIDTTFTRKYLQITAYLLDNNFYSYYKITRGFDDPVSVRLDQPDVSFISGGLGTFGSMMIDSTRFEYNSFLNIRR